MKLVPLCHGCHKFIEVRKDGSKRPFEDALKVYRDLRRAQLKREEGARENAVAVPPPPPRRHLKKIVKPRYGCPHCGKQRDKSGSPCKNCRRGGTEGWWCL